MNFRQRLARYGLGIGIGILLSVYFFSGRGCGDWLPANRIRADIRTVGGLSAHAGQSGLVDWFTASSGAPAASRVVLTHGEDRQRAALGALLGSTAGVSVLEPQRFAVIEL